MKNRIIAILGIAALSIALCVRASVAGPAAIRAQGGPTQILDSGGVNRLSISASGAAKVDGSAVTQPISAASLPLPAGASTAAKQPALGTAGSPSADVITVQGNASGTPIPVSGTVTASTSAPSATYQGQKKVAVTGTAVVIGSSQALTIGLIITASPGNTNDIYLGDSGVNNTAAPSGNGYRLMPGQSVRVSGNNVNLWYINGTANDFVTWIGN